MGKAQIISDNGDGLYTIEVKHDTTAANAQISRLNASLSQVNARIAEEQAQPEPSQNVIGALNIRKAAIEKRIVVIEEARGADYQAQAWCADLSTGLTGTVGTIEPGTEIKNGINIQPGYGGAAAWSGSRDGQATPFLTMTVADAMRNFAIMPAIQKWRPTYRYGTVSKLNQSANTCTVTLDAVFSSIQDLDVNQAPILSNVPIDYMSCNDAAFKDGDKVIVKFDGFDQSSPNVIGFKDNPRGCGPYVVISLGVGVGSQALVWDYLNNDILEIGGLSQPTTLIEIINKLDDLGFTEVNYADGVYIGQCGFGSGHTQIKSPPCLDSSQSGQRTDTFEDSESLNLVDTGDGFDASFYETVFQRLSVPGYPQDGTYTRTDDVSDYTAIVGSVYAAGLDADSGEKRKPGYYHTTGVINFSESDIMRWVGDNTYTYNCDYEKNYHYKSYIDDSNSQEDIFTIENDVAASEDDDGSGVGEIFTPAFDMFDEFEQDQMISVKNRPVVSALKDEIAVALEQPVIYNEQSDDVWGFCQLYISAEGVQTDPTDPNSPFEYEWDDLIPMDMDKIFDYFGTTFQADMESRKASAGLVVSIISSG